METTQTQEQTQTAAATQAEITAAQEAGKAAATAYVEECKQNGQEPTKRGFLGWVKDHPILTALITIALAAGIGYVIATIRNNRKKAGSEDMVSTENTQQALQREAWNEGKNFAERRAQENSKPGDPNFNRPRV